MEGRHRQKRLMDEELFMLSVAKQRHSDISPPDINSLIVKDDDDELKRALHEQLKLMPYLKLVWLPKLNIVLENKGGIIGANATELMKELLNMHLGLVLLMLLD